MNLLILKSDIASIKAVQKVSKVLNPHPRISRWTVDLDDCDKVLRIEMCQSLSEGEVQQLIDPLGYYCEELEY